MPLKRIVLGLLVVLSLHGTSLWAQATVMVGVGGGLTFTPNSVTISQGQSVTWTLSSGTHTLYIDNTTGTCSQNFSTWPVTVTFNTPGTYHYHCSIHSSCGTTSCASTCPGMVGVVIVNAAASTPTFTSTPATTNTFTNTSTSTLTQTNTPTATASFTRTATNTPTLSFTSTPNFTGTFT